MTVFAPCSIRASGINAANPNLNPAPKFGQHTLEILTSVCGLDEASINTLVQNGSVSLGWADRYLAKGNPWKDQESTYLAFIQNEVDAGDSEIDRIRHEPAEPVAETASSYPRPVYAAKPVHGPFNSCWYFVPEE